MRWKTDCTKTNDVKALEEMIDKARQITYRTFIKHVDRKDLVRLFPQYDWISGRDLTLKRDYHVGYFKSKFKNIPCVFMNHSSIEYIFY